MLTSDLVRLYPQLFHMAADGSWPSIQRHGLLSTDALLETWQAPSATGVRGESRTITHPEFGAATIRDQKPIHRDSLAAALRDMSVDDWLAELDRRVFFFLHPQSVFGMLRSPSYRTQAHTVLTIDTASFVAAHEAEIELAGINTGFAQPHQHAPRGRDTFLSIAAYPHPSRERLIKRRDVVELCVPGRVSDVARHVVRVERMRNGELLGELA